MLSTSKFSSSKKRPSALAELLSSSSSKKKNKILGSQTNEDLTPMKTARQAVIREEQDGKTTERKSQNNSEQDLSDAQLAEYFGGRSFEETLQTLTRDRNGETPFFLFQPNTNELKAAHNFLPAKTKKCEYTLVLDLDETLIHYEESDNGDDHVLYRPFAQKFVEEIAKYYEIVIFTAAQQDYADYILDRLDTTKAISHRLYRRHTIENDGVYQKDLSKIGRDLSKTLIVDNSAENFQLQPDNGIYIKSWYDDPNDRALLQLAPLLIGKKYLNFRYCKKGV